MPTWRVRVTGRFDQDEEVEAETEEEARREAIHGIFPHTVVELLDIEVEGDPELISEDGTFTAGE